MLSPQIQEKAFVYDDEALQDAVAILEQTVFRKKRIWTYLEFWCIFALPSFIYCLVSGEYQMLFCTAIFFALPILLRNSFRKEYIQANSLEQGEKMWSSNRTMTVTEEGVTIFASYLSEKPDAYDTDPEYRQYRDEIDEEMSRRNLLFRKMRVYESEKIFLLYHNRNHNQAIPKKYFQKSEIHALQTLFEEKLEKKYIRIPKEKG